MSLDPGLFALEADGWTLSFQRVSPAPLAGRSPNLGAAPFSVLARADGLWNLAVAIDPAERFWVCVRAPRRLPVAVSLVGGPELEGREVARFDDGATLRRFDPVRGWAEPGSGGEGDAHRSVEIRIGAAVQVLAELELRPRRANRGAPDVYGGWRLP